MKPLFWMMFIVVLMEETCVCQFSTALQSFDVVSSRPKEAVLLLDVPINSFKKDHLVVVMSVVGFGQHQY
jgi:hypothetical protein